MCNGFQEGCETQASRKEGNLGEEREGRSEDTEAKSTRTLVPEAASGSAAAAVPL